MAARKRNTPVLFGLCWIAAALLLLLCSQCSPLYPTNIWPDANCLLTVGRVMRSGGVLYRDIYEQKGPTLYLLHALAACLSDSDFFGVFVLETLSFAAAMYAACRMMMRRMHMGTALSCAVLTAACILAGRAFAQGDSAEEFCLPYLMAGLAVACREYGDRDGPMRGGPLFLCGLLAGMVATIKFTVLGLFTGLCMAEGVLALREGGLLRALRSAGVFLAGMLLPIAAWCAYFAYHGALDEFYTAYVYNNVFLYRDETRTAIDLLRDVWATVRGNALWVTLACAGMLALLADRSLKRQLRLALLAMGVCAFAAVYLPGRTWAYSPLALSVFAFAGWGAMSGRMPACMQTPAARRGVAALCCMLALGAAWLLSPNAPLRGVRRDELAQTRLARFLPEGATLLQYSHLDDGLYLASGTLPQQRYFVRLNVACDDMISELDRYVEEAVADYVLVSWKPLDARFDRYQLIATDAGYDDLNRVNKMLYLYRRK